MSTAPEVIVYPTDLKPPSRGKLAKALAAAQAEFTLVPKTKIAKVKGQTKDGRPYEYEYKYADLADILGMALPKLAKHEIAFNQLFRRKEGKLLLVTRLEHDGEILEDDGLIVPEQSVKPSEFGGYATYAKRYGASAFLGIATEEDVDAPQETVVVSPNKPSASEQPAAKRGRPSVQRTEVLKTVPTPNNETTTTAPSSGAAATTTVKNIHGVNIMDKDLPDFADKPTPEEMAEIKKSLKSYNLELDKLKKYVLKTTGVENTKDIGKNQWNTILANLTSAQKEGTLGELVK